MRWTCSWLVVAAMLAAACTAGGEIPTGVAVADDSVESPERLDVIEAVTVTGDGGGTVTGDNVMIIAPAGISAAELDVEIRSPIPVPDHELTGPVVTVIHPAALTAPITVEWDVSTLTAQQQTSLMLVRWDDTAGAWLVEDDQPFTVDNGLLRAPIARWSNWAWIANASQEIQELFGRRKDPPECDRSPPSWVGAFNDPGADTSAAAILVCLEDDPNDTSVLTKRIVNNRTTAQIVHIGGDEPVAWAWQGDLPLGIAAAVHTAASAVLSSPTRVLVPPLHEVAVGVRQPGTPGTAYVEFSNELNAATILADTIAFAAGKANIGGAFDNPMMAIFFEVLLECGIADVVAWRGDTAEMARSVISALTGCVDLITNNTTELGRVFEQRVQERLRDYPTPQSARNAIKANRLLHTVARYVKYLALFEVVGYYSDILLEGAVGPLTWGVALTGQSRPPSAWTPTCSDVVADQEAWSRAWVLQPVFNEPPLRDFHTYDEFAPIVTEATRPLANCSIEHVTAVRDQIAGVGFQTGEASVIALKIIHNLLDSMEGERLVATGLDSCEGLDTAPALYGGASIVTSVCSWPWALVLTTGPMPTLTVAALYMDGYPAEDRAFFYDVEDGRFVSNYTPEALAEASGMPIKTARLLYEALGGSDAGNFGGGPIDRQFPYVIDNIDLAAGTITVRKVVDFFAYNWDNWLFGPPITAELADTFYAGRVITGSQVADTAAFAEFVNNPPAGTPTELVTILLETADPPVVDSVFLFLDGGTGEGMDWAYCTATVGSPDFNGDLAEQC